MDPSEWTLLNSKDSTDLATLFRAKLSGQEVFGLRLWWDADAVGGEFLVFPNHELAFVPSMNRVTIGNRATDVSWYLSKILPIFRQDLGLTFESWLWRESPRRHRAGAP
jgi:hypothetical protein